MEIKAKEIGLILVIYVVLTFVRILINMFVAFDYVSGMLFDSFLLFVIMAIGIALIQIDKKI